MRALEALRAIGIIGKAVKDGATKTWREEVFTEDTSWSALFKNHGWSNLPGWNNNPDLPTWTDLFNSDDDSNDSQG